MEFGLLLWKYPGKLDYSLKIHEQIRAPRAQPGNICKPYTQHTQKSRTNHSSAPATLGMSKTVSHPTLQVISCTLAIKRNLTFDTANWSFIFLVPREKKIKRRNHKTSCWVCLDTGNVGDVNWLYEISEINYLCKRMSFVYSTVRVAATQSLESWSQCTISSPGYCFLYVQCVYSI